MSEWFTPAAAVPMCQSLTGESLRATARCLHLCTAARPIRGAFVTYLTHEKGPPVKNIFLVLVLLTLVSHTAQAVPIDFSGFSPGDSIEGLGTVHPLLNIATSNAAGAALFPAMAPTTYGASNPGGPVIGNGGLSPSGGFADIDSSRLHDFEFSWASGVTVSAFSIRMLDHGDFNPAHARSHRVVFEALDAFDGLVDSAELSYTSTAATNPRGGSAGDLFFTGDALRGSPGEPGVFTFGLSGSSITRVRVLYEHDGPDRPPNAPSDPNIAFDSLDIDFNSTPVPEPGSLVLVLGGLAVLRFGRRRS